MTAREPYLAGVLAVACACTVASCGSSAEALARYGGPISSSDVERGRDRYDVVCAPCHADHNDRRAPLFSEVRLPAPAIRRQVREGDSFMPAVPLRRLPDADLEALLAFLRTTGTCITD